MPEKLLHLLVRELTPVRNQAHEVAHELVHHLVCSAVQDLGLEKLMHVLHELIPGWLAHEMVHELAHSAALELVCEEVAGELEHHLGRQ